MTRINRKPHQFGIRFYGHGKQAKLVIPGQHVRLGATRASVNIAPGGVFIRIGGIGNLLRPNGDAYLLNIPSEVLRNLSPPLGSTPINGEKMWGDRWFLPVTKKGA